MKQYNYINRKTHPGVIQVGMFSEITDISQIKPGDQFIENLGDTWHITGNAILHTIEKINDETHLKVHGMGSFGYWICLKLEGIDKT